MAKVVMTIMLMALATNSSIRYQIYQTPGQPPLVVAALYCGITPSTSVHYPNSGLVCTWLKIQCREKEKEKPRCLGFYPFLESNLCMSEGPCLVAGEKSFL